MAGLGGFDLSFGGISPIGNVAALGSIAMDGDEYVRCNSCGYGGCDVRVSGCGCTLHAVSDSNVRTFPTRKYVESDVLLLKTRM